MAINRIHNGDSGSIVRQIINSIIDLVNGFGNAISDLATKVTGIENAIGNSIFTQEDRNKLDNAVTTTVLTSELQKKVTAIPGSRLITESESTKLANSIDTNTLTNAISSRVAIETKEVKSLLLNEDDITAVYFRLHQEEREGVTPGDLKLSVKDLFKPLATFDVVGVTFKEIIHNMGEGFYPSVKFLDTEGNLVACSVKYSSGGIILVSWNSEKSGKIILTR